jgi:hypothetical protein
MVPAKGSDVVGVVLVVVVVVVVVDVDVGVVVLFVQPAADSAATNTTIRTGVICVIVQSKTSAATGGARVSQKFHNRSPVPIHACR